MTTINFEDVEKCRSQRTIVKVLSTHEYYFVRVNEYDNNFFTCIVKCKIKDFSFIEFLQKIRTILGKPRKNKYTEIVLSLGISGENGEVILEPIVFSREEIDQIISDIPSTYIGEKIL